MSLTHYITKVRFSVWMSRIIWPLFWYYDTSWHKTYDWLTKFRNTFQTIPAIYFQQRNRHLAPPVAPCYAQASPNKIFQGRSLKGPGKGDILELTKLADCVYLMYILQVLVVLFVCFRVPWSIHPGRLRSSQSDREKRRDETSSARACKLCRAVSPDLTVMLNWDCPWVSDDGSVATITLVFASHTPLKTTDSTAFLKYRPQRKWIKLFKLQLNNGSVVLLPCRSQFKNWVKILEMFNVY